MHGGTFSRPIMIARLWNVEKSRGTSWFGVLSCFGHFDRHWRCLPPFLLVHDFACEVVRRSSILLFSLPHFSGAFPCIQLRPSTRDGISVIATLGSLSPALETPWEMWGVGSATLGQHLRCLRVPVLGESLLLSSSSLYDRC